MSGASTKVLRVAFPAAGSRRVMRFRGRGASLGLGASNTAELIQQIERGFSFATLRTLEVNSGLALSLLASILGILEREVCCVAGRAGARRGLPLKSDPAIRRSLRALLRRADAAAAASIARPEDRVRAVGGAVRDAFLGRRGGDLDLVAPPGSAEKLAAKLAARAGSRVVPIGAPPKRILKVPFRSHEIDVWEETGDPAADLLRRDFTVNALSFSLPEGTFASAPGALADLAARRLTPPRPGVFREDPLRVLRAARFLAQLPGFRVASRATPELKEAAKSLRV